MDELFAIDYRIYLIAAGAASTGAFISYAIAYRNHETEDPFSWIDLAFDVTAAIFFGVLGILSLVLFGVTNSVTLTIAAMLLGFFNRSTYIVLNNHGNKIAGWIGAIGMAKLKTRLEKIAGVKLNGISDDK